jgi:K+-transporting ATPase ATPase C chain
MLKAIRISLVTLVLFTFLLGFIYPGIVTLVLQTVFPHAANGSLITDKNGKVLGSELIGQNFTQAKYFWGRLSATIPAYNAASSSGSNFGVNNPDLLKAVQARIKDLHDADPDNTAPIPVDLVTASASGLDPHISLAAAEYQVMRVAHARNISSREVHDLITQNTNGRQLGFLGEPSVNVLKLNLALDALK